MSIKTLTLIAAVAAGTIAFGERANAQVIYATGGYTYSPGVVTTSSYYTPASSWSYYSSPAYYSTPYNYGVYAGAPAVYGGIYGAPAYYGSYYGPYYRAGLYGGIGPRRWWR